MTTVATFNKTLLDFIVDLSETFDDVPEIGLLKAMIPQLIRDNETAAVDLFMNAMEPYAKHILNRDATMFESPVILGTLDVSTLWNADGLDDVTRSAIMDYVNSLFVLGMTLQKVDGAVLGQIESLAGDAAKSLKQSGSLDIASLMPGLMQNVGQMLGMKPDEIPDMNDPEMKKILDSVMQNFTGSSFAEYTENERMDCD